MSDTSNALSRTAKLPHAIGDTSGTCRQDAATSGEAIHKPSEEPESEERSRARTYLQARREVARADERDRPPLPHLGSPLNQKSRAARMGA
jgi:hypothetical protein